MIEAMAVMLRIALARAANRPAPLSVLKRVVDLARADYQVFGPSPGTAAVGPVYTPEEARVLQMQALKATIRNAVDNVPLYSELAPDGRIGKLDFTSVPLTTREHLVSHPESMFNRRCPDIGFFHQSSGTTRGTRTPLLYTHYEIEALSLVSAADALARDVIRPDDVILNLIPYTATLDIYSIQRTASALGACCLTPGVIDPEQAVDMLLSRLAVPGHRDRPSILSAETSHAVSIASVIRQRGLSAGDLGLRRVLCGGELMPSAYREFLRETLGAPVEIAYGASEVFPALAGMCANDNYHVEQQFGWWELLDPVTCDPVSDDSVGVLVITPFYPMRQGMPVLRYRTGDLGRRVPCDCGLPTTGGVFQVLGREAFAVHCGGGLITQMDVLERLAGVDGVPLPVRYHYEARDDLLTVHVHGGSQSARLRNDIELALAPLAPRVRAVVHDQPDFPYLPLRWEKHLSRTRSAGEAIT